MFFKSSYTPLFVFVFLNDIPDCLLFEMLITIKSVFHIKKTTTYDIKPKSAVSFRLLMFFTNKYHQNDWFKCYNNFHRTLKFKKEILNILFYSPKKWDFWKYGVKCFNICDNFQINHIAKMSTDSPQRDVLLDIRDSFVLSVSTMYVLLIFDFLMHVYYWTCF